LFYLNIGLRKDILKLLVHFFARSKGPWLPAYLAGSTTKVRSGQAWKGGLKDAQQLGLRLSSRNARTRGRQELIPLFAGLRQLATLNPYSHPSLGCAATGFKIL